jgi:HEAT repeat protein
LGGETAIQALRKALAEDDFYEVRAEAALALGEACDRGSVAALTDWAQALSQGAVGEGPLLVGLASVTSLKRLNPPDLKQRMEPLLSKKVSGVLRNQVQLRLETPSAPSCPVH